VTLHEVLPKLLLCSRVFGSRCGDHRLHRHRRPKRPAELLRRAADEQPGVSLMLRELVSTDQVDGLVKGAVDIGLLRPIVGRPGIVSRPLMRDRLLVALPADSDLPSGDGPLRLRALEGQPLMMYSTAEARYFHDLVLRLFASSGVRPNITQYASQVPALLAFVEAGCLVAGRMRFSAQKHLLSSHRTMRCGGWESP
jgi:DNA-binding transcriptional LysR family regulator